MVTQRPRPHVSGWAARGAVLAFTVVYGAGALYFFVQETWARAPVRAEKRSLEELHHPEAVLGILREHADGVYPNELRPALSRAVELAPSFYQGPLFYADFLAQRREEPQRARALFEIAVRRFPTNGRIRLAYAEWLLTARSDLSMMSALGPTDPLSLAESHLRRALALEPELSQRALSTLEAHRVPAERWRSLLPPRRGAERALVLVLHEGGHHRLALEELRALIQSTNDVDELAEAAGWALAWGAPALALEAIGRVSPEASTKALVRTTRLAARAHWAVGESDAAYEAFEQTLQTIERRYGADDPKRLELLCAAGDEYFRRRELLVAESFYAAALVQDGGSLPANLGLARTYRGRHESDAAVAHYEKVLRLDAGHESARRELEGLLQSR